jgi:transposase
LRVAEIITVERRRRWSEEDKRRIVAETFEAGASVSAVAKRHGLYPGQVFSWRRALRQDDAGRACAQGPSGFAPVVIAEPRDDAERLPPSQDRKATRSTGRIEIILGRQRRVVVGADVDAAALRRVLDVLERE